MKRITVLIAVSALIAGLGWSLSAQEAAPTVGKVLILKNQQVVEGDVEKVGDFYRVRKGMGKLTVPVAQALRLCADWDDAVSFMRFRTKLNDPDQRLQFARWCQANRQLEHAHEEAKLALEMRPKHAETIQFLKSLEITTANKPAVKPVAEPGPPSPPLPQLELTFEAVSAFNLRVQPILVNTCVNCHAGSYGGKFRLCRLHEGGERAATQRNLAAVMAQINLERPASSPLLVSALSAHGGAKSPPIGGKQSPAFFALCTWIDQTLADNPHLFDKSVAAPLPVPVSMLKAPEAPVAVPKTDIVGTSKQPMTPLPGVVVSKVSAAPVPPMPVTQVPMATKTTPAPVPQGPRGEYDPGEFNDWAHPLRK